MQMKKQIGVIGGGAAGMMAGVYLARAGHEGSHNRGKRRCTGDDPGA